MKQLLARLRAALRTFADGQAELRERADLLNRPWEEQFLHWSGPEGQLLHGNLLPPPGRQRSTTRNGWCPQQRL